MDAYILAIPGCDISEHFTLTGGDIEIHGPDQVNGWTLEGSESVVLAAIERLQGFGLVRMFVIL